MTSRLKASSRDGDSAVGSSAARVGAVAWTGDGSSAESRPITGGSAQRVPVGAVVVVVPGRRAAPTAREAPSGVRQADEGPAAALARGGGLLLHDLKSA